MWKYRSVGPLSGLLVALLAFAGCSSGPSPETQARLDSLQTERDSLARTLAEREANVQALSRQIEEALGEASGAGEATPETLGDRIAAIRTELSTARTQLEEARQRIGTLGRRAANLRDSVAAVTQRAEQDAAAHRDSIQALVASTQTMETSIEELTTRRSALEETVASLEDRLFTGYVAIGTKDELLERGVVAEEGGARVLLLFWRAGETLVPARGLDPDQFDALDIREATTLPLPAAGTYHVVSRHDTGLLEPSPDGEGRFTGQSLRITDPQAFWRFSPFLILVRED